jgi:hypothetical protein
MSGQTIGAFFTALLSTALINPNNEPAFIAEVYPGWYERFFTREIAYFLPLVLAIICLVWTMIVIMSYFTMTVKKEDKFLWEDVPDFTSSQEFLHKQIEAK